MSAATRIVKFVATQRSIVKIEKLYIPFREVSARIKEDFTSEKQLEVWVNASKNTLKTRDQKLNPNMKAVLYINILLNSITAGKLDMN